MVIFAGFTSYEKGLIFRNPSEEIVKSVAEKLKEKYYIFPVSYKRVKELVNEICNKEEDEKVMVVGLHYLDQNVRIERILLNVADGTDEDRYNPNGEMIDKNYPLAVFTDIDAYSLKEELLKNEIPAIVSNFFFTSAYLCNYTAFLFKTKGKKVCLIHIPFPKEYITEAIKSNKGFVTFFCRGGLPKSDLEKAIEICYNFFNKI